MQRRAFAVVVNQAEQRQKPHFVLTLMTVKKRPLNDFDGFGDVSNQKVGLTVSPSK